MLAVFTKDSLASRRQDNGFFLMMKGPGISSSGSSLPRSCSDAELILAYSTYSPGQRPLLADKKGFIDHLKPKRFVKSTIRVVIMQGTQTMTHYMNDQFKADIARDELVMTGKMTRVEADDEADEWAEREWKKRWENFPHRLAVAYAKYHAIILMMRFYEYLASKTVDTVTLDKLTLDTFESAKRSADKYSGRELVSDVYRTGMYANVISYAADYTVHQLILCAGYFVYYQALRNKRRKMQDDKGDDEYMLQEVGSLALSFIKNSTLLALSRGVGLIFSSLGGAFGSLFFLPGWGSLAGFNLGDGIAMAISDDFVGAGPPFAT